MVGEQVSEQDRIWVRRALANARSAVEVGESPFGAVVANGALLLGEGWNKTVSGRSPIRHAEIAALEHALGASGGELPSSATLYSSCAPCIMCLGATFYAGLRRAVYAIDIRDVIPLGSGDPNIEPTEVNRSCGLGLVLVAHVYRDEALQIVSAARAMRGRL